MISQGGNIPQRSAPAANPMVNTSELVVAQTRPDGTVFMAPRFEWDGARHQAATDVAEGTWRTVEIANRAGVDPVAIRAWQKHPDFAARVDEICEEMRERVKHLGIARVEVRVAAQNERWLGLHQVIKERAESHYGCAGGSTGLLAHDQKQIGGGENAKTVDEYKVDTGLLKEIRELEKHAAQELGQWTEKKEITRKDGGAVQNQAILLAKLLTPDQLDALHQAALAEVSRGSIEGACEVVVDGPAADVPAEAPAV